MPTIVTDPPILINTTLIPAVAGIRIIPVALYIGQAGGIGFLSTTTLPATIVGPRCDASAGATQMAYALESGLWEMPVGEGLVFNNGFSAGGVPSHICLTYRTEMN